ncbi:MFS transporter, partial [Roseiarcus sp.]|uniref:MFS transporter n=1 Tax=Roseiarcus sp. TaxID=1969460 RepID=UPI003C62785E
MAGWLGGIGDALADRNFRIYSVASILSWLSFFIQMVAMSWTTWELTHSTAWLAIIAALDIAANVIFAPLGGALADRFDRFRMVLIAYAAAWVHVLALTILAYAGALTIAPLAALSFLHGLIHAFSVPAAFGMMPRFIGRERLSSAIAVSSAYTQFAIFAGPAIAGWIILHYGVVAAYATNVVGYLVYFATVAFLRTPNGFVRPAPSGRSIVGDIADGMRYIAGHRGISALLLLMLMGDPMSTAVYQMLPAIADKMLGSGVHGMSSLLSAAGLGATFSALWLAHGGTARATSNFVLWAFLAFTLAVGALMLTEHIVIAVAVMVAYGFAGEARRTGTVSLLQTSVSDAHRGRVMSTQFMLQRLAGGVGTVL